MSNNRYEGLLSTHNGVILDFNPANVTLRETLAFELRKVYGPGDRVLDLGCGEGDSALPILRFIRGVRMTLLDASSEMLERCKYRIETNGRDEHWRTPTYVCADALAHLQASDEKCDHNYDHVISEWTFHNFPWPYKIALFKRVYDCLPRRPVGGLFLLMDKIPPDKGGGALLEAQCRRYRYLRGAVRDAIIAHEREDATDEYRMEETQTIQCLRKIGFSSVEIVDRVERDAVLVCKK